MKTIRPDFGVQCLPCSSEEALRLLLNGETELAIGSQVKMSYELIAKKAADEDFIAVYPKKQLHDCPLVFLSYVPDVSKWASLGDETHNFRKIWVIPDWNVIRDLVVNGVGWAVLPRPYLAKTENVRQQDLPKSLAQRTVLYWMYRREHKNALWLKNIVVEI